MPLHGMIKCLTIKSCMILFYIRFEIKFIASTKNEISLFSAEAMIANNSYQRMYIDFGYMRVYSGSDWLPNDLIRFT